MNHFQMKKDPSRSASGPNRRVFLRSSGVLLALPLLDGGKPHLADAATPRQATSPQRMVCICSTLGLHAPFLYPENPTSGANYELSPYLKILGEHRSDFTLFRGLSHPNQSGKNGHSSFETWLTSVQHPGLVGFRNRISIDQLLAQQIGLETRFSSLQLGTNAGSQSCSASGILLPAETSPSKLFAKLFIEGTEKEKTTQIQKLREGRSILDTVREEAKRFGRSVGTGDRETLAEYYQSVREMEQRLVIAEEWINKPKPKIDAKPPTDIDNQSDLIGRMRLLFDLIPLIIQTDSTRLITVVVQGRGDVPPIPGVSIDHHNLSHHGKDENKIRQLRLIEEAQFQAFNGLLDAMTLRNGMPSDQILNNMFLNKTKKNLHSRSIDRS